MSRQDKITAVFLADTHLGFDYPIKPRTERRRRGDDFFNNFKAVLKYAVEEKADLLLHGGDFFFRSKIPGKVIALAYDILFDFAQNNIPVFIIPGNHEYSRLPESLLLHHPSIHIFDEPRVFNINIGGWDASISGFPFVRESISKQFPSIIRNLESRESESSLKLLLMHQTVEGAKVAGYTFRKGPDVISGEDLPEDYHAILSGHIHRKQVLNFKRPAGNIQVIYPGSVERTAFAEKDEDKGFYRIDFLNNGGTWEMAELKFIELPARPMVDITVESTDAGSVEKELKEKFAKADPDSIVRLNCPSSTVRDVITAAMIRRCAPSTMNIQLKFNTYNK